MLTFLHVNRLERKVLLVVILIILVPMMISGMLSARWITSRMDDSIEGWIRESTQVEETALEDLHHNASLLADILNDVSGRGGLLFKAGWSPIPPNLQSLVEELGITLIQVYDYDGELMYSSLPVTLATTWERGQDTAVVKAVQNDKNLLAAINIVRIPLDQTRHYRLVLGTLFDKAFLQRLNRTTRLKTRLYYPRNGDFANAFSEDEQPLKLSLPPSAFERLNNRQDYYSPVAEDGRYWGLYSPVVDASGKVEAVLFSGLERVAGAKLLADRGGLTVAIFLLGIVLATGTGLLLGRIVIGPVKYLHDAVMRVAAQDFRASIPVQSDDELGQLGRAFNTMADSLREARDQQRHEFQRDKLTALGELSMALAHEIRNPIAVINTASKLLENTRSTDKQAELKRMIREEGQRLDHFLKDFQQLARYRSPELVEIDPAEPLDRALQVMLAGNEDVVVERRYTHQGATIQGDPELLRQAWINLIRNALEAMGPEAGRLEAGSSMTDDAIILYLQDSGPGIPIEQMTRLFEPFHTTKAQGSGLGLTIANTLAEANGAWLELVPGDWRGARFSMRFPRIPAGDS
jgi:nitrogen fixation/metabolism regulation signal transduction histidine kinase